MSSLLSQSERFHLAKPPSYHYDYAVLGLILVLCGLLGVPPGNGLIPQAPLHVRALATIEEVAVDDADALAVELVAARNARNQELVALKRESGLRKCRLRSSS